MFENKIMKSKNGTKTAYVLIKCEKMKRVGKNRKKNKTGVAKSMNSL